MLDNDYSPAEIEELLNYCTADEKAEVLAILAADTQAWRPLPGPQTMAYNSDADVLGYGGAAGGGKTDLMCGSAINRHKISYIFRREATQMKGIYRRMAEILGGNDGFNRQDKIWRLGGGREVQFGSVPNLGDEMNYQGQARDLLGIDEAANFLEEQIVFLMGWVRTTDPSQRTQSLLTFNPPTSAEGRWIVDFFGPWLDDKHPIPALPGEKRWFAIVKGKSVEVTDGRPFVMPGGDSPIYDFDPRAYNPAHVIRPQSRTFVPSRISDNPFLVKTGYMATLQALPEPLRSQMLLGDFKAGMTDDPWQVIPTAWIKAAQDRWRKPDVLPRMDSLGVDVARGGSDTTTIARRHGMWFDEPLVYPGKETPDGPSVAGLVIAANRDHAPIHIDVIGVGSSPYDFLKNARQQVMGVNVAERALGTDRSGRLSFANQRAQFWWQFREALDPSNNMGIALPPDRDLELELAAPKWKLRGDAIAVESREEIIDRIGRSPDRATAYLLALIDTPRMSDLTRDAHSRARRDYDPYRRR